MVMEVRQCRAIVIDDSEVRLFFSYQASGFKTIGFDDVELDLGVLLLEDAEQARNQQGGLLLRHGQAHLAMAVSHFAYIFFEYIDFAQQGCDFLCELLPVLADPDGAAAAQKEVEPCFFLNGLHGLT